MRTCLLICLALPLALHAQTVQLKLQNRVAYYCQEHAFSGSVLVAKDGEILYRGSCGYADDTGKIPNSPEHQYLIGSTTKSFTATLAMQFVDRGLIALDTPLQKYLPDLRADLGRDLTMHLLLKQMSGFPSNIERIGATFDKDIDHNTLLKLINQADMKFTPGSSYAYSNVAYNLAATVLCEVSGLSYPELVEYYILQPLEMCNTVVERKSNTASHKAKGYNLDADGHRSAAVPHHMAYAMGSGDIVSTVDDIYRWDQALYDDALVSEASKKIMFTGATEEFGFYGYGFRIREYTRPDTMSAKGKLVRHGGSMRGYLANVHRYVDDRITVIVLGNVRPFPIRDMCTDFKEIVSGREPTE